MSSEVTKKQDSPLLNLGSVAKKLETLMDRVTEGEASVERVNAACNCAGKISEIVKLHLEAARLARKFP